MSCDKITFATHEGERSQLFFIILVHELELQRESWTFVLYECVPLGRVQVKRVNSRHDACCACALAWQFQGKFERPCLAGVETSIGATGKSNTRVFGWLLPRTKGRSTIEKGVVPLEDSDKPEARSEFSDRSCMMIISHQLFGQDPQNKIPSVRLPRIRGVRRGLVTTGFLGLSRRASVQACSVVPA